MKVVAAYLLALLGGNRSPSADDVKDILESVGCDVDDVKIEVLLTLLKGKDITELIASGRAKLASVPSSSSSSGVAEAVGATTELKKKEESVEEKEESDGDLGFSLFD